MTSQDEVLLSFSVHSIIWEKVIKEGLKKKTNEIYNSNKNVLSTFLLEV